MRQIAKEQGKKISEYGVEQEDGTVEHLNQKKNSLLILICHLFHQLFVKMDRIYEVRSITNLVKLNDIKADLHMHTTWSDGAHSIEEMVEACRAKGYSIW